MIFFWRCRFCRRPNEDSTYNAAAILCTHCGKISPVAEVLLSDHGSLSSLSLSR